MTIPLPVGIIFVLICFGLLVWIIGRGGGTGRGSTSGGMGTL